MSAQDAQPGITAGSENLENDVWQPLEEEGESSDSGGGDLAVSGVKRRARQSKADKLSHLAQAAPGKPAAGEVLQGAPLDAQRPAAAAQAAPEAETAAAAVLAWPLPLCNRKRKQEQLEAGRTFFCFDTNIMGRSVLPAWEAIQRSGGGTVQALVPLKVLEETGGRHGFGNAQVRTMLRDGRCCRVQRKDEVFRRHPFPMRHQLGDDSILDCLLYFASLGATVVLVSEDKGLRQRVQDEGMTALQLRQLPEALAAAGLQCDPPSGGGSGSGSNSGSGSGSGTLRGSGSSNEASRQCDRNGAADPGDAAGGCATEAAAEPELLAPGCTAAAGPQPWGSHHTLELRRLLQVPGYQQRAMGGAAHPPFSVMAFSAIARWLRQPLDRVLLAAADLLANLRAAVAEAEAARGCSHAAAGEQPLTPQRQQVQQQSSPQPEQLLQEEGVVGATSPADPVAGSCGEAATAAEAGAAHQPARPSDQGPALQQEQEQQQPSKQLPAGRPSTSLLPSFLLLEPCWQQYQQEIPQDERQRHHPAALPALAEAGRCLQDPVGQRQQQQQPVAGQHVPLLQLQPLAATPAGQGAEQAEPLGGRPGQPYRCWPAGAQRAVQEQQEQRAPELQQEQEEGQDLAQHVEQYYCEVVRLVVRMVQEDWFRSKVLSVGPKHQGPYMKLIRRKLGLKGVNLGSLYKVATSQSALEAAATLKAVLATRTPTNQAFRQWKLQGVLLRELELLRHPRAREQQRQGTLPERAQPPQAPQQQQQRWQPDMARAGRVGTASVWQELRLELQELQAEQFEAEQQELEQLEAQQLQDVAVVLQQEVAQLAQLGGS